MGDQFLYHRAASRELAFVAWQPDSVRVILPSITCDANWGKDRLTECAGLWGSNYSSRPHQVLIEASRRALMAKRGRKPGPKKPKNDKPPGRTSWVTGTKLTFLDSRRETWQRAVDAGPAKAGQFYSNITKLFIKKYGYDLPLHEDLEVDVEDPPDECVDDEDPEQEDMDEEEAERRSEIYNTIRTVSYFLFCECV